MSETLRSLLTDPVFYIGLAGVGWVVRIAVKKLIESGVDHQFAARLEKHRHELQLIAEEVRFELQRRLTGAGLYLQKQHAAAAEIYRAVRVAHGAVGGLLGIQRGLVLDDCNEQDLREILEKYEVLRGKQDELIVLWHQNRKDGIEKIQEHLLELSVPWTDRKLQEARNLMYVNEIYFSDESIAAFDRFVGECNKWILRRQFPPQRGDRIEPLSRDLLNQALDEVQVALRAELSNKSGKELTRTRDTSLLSPPADPDGDG